MKMSELAHNVSCLVGMAELITMVIVLWVCEYLIMNVIYFEFLD